MTTIRMFLTPGGFAAALTCLVLTACGQPGTTDSGMMPMPDAYMAMGDGGMPMPDAYVPDSDAGMPDGDAGTDGGGTCTADMMLNRVSPPCDPDNNPDFGPGTGPTGLEGHVGTSHDWQSPSGVFGTGLDTDPMGRIELGFHCAEAGSDPYQGFFYYSADGIWYANWVNRHVPGIQGNHARITFDADFRGATLEVFDGGSDTPRATYRLLAV